MQTSSTTFSEIKTDGLAVGSSDDQYVRVRVGGLEFVMSTEHLSGVHQVSRQNRLTERGTVLTKEGEYPVVQLGQILSEKLNRKIEYAAGRALISVDFGGKTSMLLTDSVSRPSKIRPEHVHPIAQIALNKGDELIRSVVNVDPSSDNPNDCVRLCFDPRVAVGHSVPMVVDNKPNLLPKEAASAIAVAVAASKKSDATGAKRSNQLLAFIPEDIATGEVEHVFCLPLTAIAEVITTQPNLNDNASNEVFDGFVLWRKVPVPIVRLGKIFGFKSDENVVATSRRLVVARAPGNRFIGFYAKAQMQTMKVPESVGGKSGAFTGRPHLGCFRTELGEVVVPDIDRILNGDFKTGSNL